MLKIANDKSANSIKSVNLLCKMAAKGIEEEKIIDLKDCPLIGNHNYQNVMCSVIVAKLEGISNEDIKNSIMSFKVPEHRLEKFAQNGKTVFTMILRLQILKPV